MLVHISVSVVVQVLLLSGATVDAGKEENVHVNKRQRLDPTPSGLGDDDDDEVRCPSIQSCLTSKLQ